MNEMHSFAELATALAASIGRTAVALEAGMGEAARVIQEDAKARIGEYQREVASFPGWPALAPATVEDRVRQGYAPDEPLLRTGDLRESIEAQHTAAEAVVGSKLAIAAYQEYGTNRIPPRPFIGPAAVASMDRVCRILGNRAVQGLSGQPVLSIDYGPATPSGSAER